MQGHFALGETLFWLGDLMAAHDHLTQSLTLASRQSSSASADVVGTRVACLAYAAWILWPLGYATQALNRAHEAVTLVQELAHPYTSLCPGTCNLLPSDLWQLACYTSGSRDTHYTHG
jgi:hypothetical protein